MDKLYGLNRTYFSERELAPKRCGEVNCPHIAETGLGRCYQHRETIIISRSGCKFVGKKLIHNETYCSCDDEVDEYQQDTRNW